jgi:hypothetical protein
MTQACGVALALIAAAVPALAQDPVYQQPPPQNPVRLRLEGLARQEWTQDILAPDGTTSDVDRWRGRLLPALEIGGERFLLGVGGDFNHSSDENDEPAPALIRDNYRSRDARLDLAYARLRPLGWLRLEGGRFPMPLPFTEMIWDRDLRPQGLSGGLVFRDLGSLTQLGLTVLGARGSHVFDDDETEMLVGAVEAVFSGSPESDLHLMAAYLEFRDLAALEPMIRRQNTRVAGLVQDDYRIVDLVARYSWNGDPPVQLVADYCWNTALSESNRGLWLAAVLGSLQTSRLRADYTYASVDRDATVAAYGTDDFFWVTGWKGHRLDLGTRISQKSSLHAVGQLQKFKDSPRPEERDHWVKRLRLEARINF